MASSIFNFLGKIYVNKTLKKRGNPFELFKQKKAGTTLPPADKGVIFLGPIRMSAEAHLFEGILGYAYRLKGYKVYAVMCGQKLTDCETLPHGKSFTAPKCAACFNQQKIFSDTFDVEPLYIGDYLSSEEESRIDQNVEGLSLEQMEFDGIDMSSHVTSGVMRVLRKSSLDPEDLSLVKRFGKTTMTTMTACRNMMKKFKPDHIIMSHGTYSSWGALILAAEEENVHAVVWGRGYVGSGNLYAANDRSYLFQNVYEPKSNFQDLDLNAHQLRQLHDYFSGKRNPNKKVDYVSYYASNENILNEVDIRMELKIPEGKVIAGMFPNIPWDGQAFSYSELFPSIREFVITTIEWFKGKDAYLVIRAHPAELHARSSGQLETFQNILEELYPTLPENVIFLPADSYITSYQIESSISAALLYAGTIGLEFSVNGTPVIQTGKNASSDKGFIFEPSSKENYAELLQKVISNELFLTDEMKTDCEKYAYHWVFRRHFPEKIIDFEGALKFKGYNFDKPSEILENDVLQQFMSCIEERKDFIYYPPSDS
jgi:hypothetical protein